MVKRLNEILLASCLALAPFAGSASRADDFAEDFEDASSPASPMNPIHPANPAHSKIFGEEYKKTARDKTAFHKGFTTPQYIISGAVLAAALASLGVACAYAYKAFKEK